MKGRFRRKRRQNEEDVSLQVTSLADILIIVLVFLLKSFSTGLSDMENVTISKGIRLPMVVAAGVSKTGLQIEVSRDVIQLDGKPVSQLKQFRFLSRDLNNDLAVGGTSRSLIRAIGDRIKEYEKEGRKNILDRVWVVADQRAPYMTIQTVLASAAANGYTDFKLAVTQAQ